MVQPKHMAEFVYGDTAEIQDVTPSASLGRAGVDIPFPCLV